MKIEETNVQAMTSEEFKTYEFRVDQKMAQIIFRDKLYSAEGKLRVIAQEYMANARDAHRAAGKSDTPIEVTLPTKLAPEFVVRDFGNGITPKVVQDIFVVYGASTKKGNNEQNGGYGIGAKCAFSYANAFSVTTIVDGLRYIYAASIDSNNMNQFTLMDTSPSTEQSGTEIRVPIRVADIVSLRSWVAEITQAWNPRPIPINQNVAYLDVAPIGSGERWQLYRGTNPFSYRGVVHGIYVTVDDIPYVVSAEQAAAIGKSTAELHKILAESNHTLVMNFKVGEVTIPPQRETIDLTDRTKDTITRHADTFIKLQTDSATAKVAAAVTVLDKVSVAFADTLDLLIARALGDIRQDLATYGSEFDPTTYGFRLHVSRFVRGTFRRWETKEHTTLRNVMRRSDESNRYGEHHWIAVDTCGKKLSEALVKQIAREHMSGYCNVTVLEIFDAKLFEDKLGVTPAKMADYSYITCVRKPASKAGKHTVRSGHLFIPVVKANYNSYSGATDVEVVNRKTEARGDWTGDIVFVKRSGNRYSIKDQLYSLEELGVMLLIAKRVSYGSFTSAEVHVWSDRLDEYCEPDSNTFIDDYIDTTIALALKLDTPALANLAYDGVVPFVRAPNWPLAPEYSGNMGNSTMLALRDSGYTSLFIKMVKLVCEAEHANPPTAFLATSWPGFNKLIGSELSKKVQAAAHYMEAVRVELLQVMYSTPLMPYLFNQAADRREAHGMRVNGAESDSVPWSSIVRDQLVSHSPINPLFKA